MRIKWTDQGWRVSGLNMSFVASNYTEAFFFVKYEADIDADFMLDYIMGD